MEKIPNQTPENSDKNSPNFHELSENRKELKKAIGELGGDGAIFDKHYKEPLQEIESEISKFKMADFGGLAGAKKALKKQKAEYEATILKDRAHIDFETILKNTPEVDEVLNAVENIANLKDFRMKRMFEILSPETSLATKKINEEVLETIKKEIKGYEEKMEQTDPLVLRQAELIKYKENLSQSGHICITPSVEKDLETIGNRMLTGDPILLYGPTGTGKTSLAKYASEHFTGKRARVVACSSQTRESNVYGRSGIRPTGSTGAMETYIDYGPLVKAAKEGCSVIFDEFNTLDPGLLVVLKNVFATRIGDALDIPGNESVIIRPGFQAIFTANLKSEKNPEKNDLPPEILREFDVNSIKAGYTPPAEAYDIMISRLLNKDGSLDMSFYDLNITLPNLCKVMAETQESYTNETNKSVAERAGAINRTTGKFHSLKKFVMTQGSVQKILSLWRVDRETSKADKSFAEFLDQNFKAMLTLEGYPKEDRVLAAKILASKGFLLTLTARELDLPDDIFKLNTIKAMRGDDAVDELKQESGAIKHLTLKEVAELDPFGKRAELLKNRAEALLGDEGGEKDLFLNGLNKKIGKIFGKEKKNYTPDLSASYTHPDKTQETITLNIESSLQDFLSFYQKTNINLPPDFESSIQDIWERHYDDMQEAIKQHGFNNLLLVPGNIPLTELKDKMSMEQGYWEGNNFKDGGSFAKAQSQNTDKPRLILVHNAQNLKDRPELKQTLNTKGQDVKPDQALTLEDYLIFQRKYFEETNKHLDEDGWTWLATKSGARLVDSSWASSDHQLYVAAHDLGDRDGTLGVRPSRCFW